MSSTVRTARAPAIPRGSRSAAARRRAIRRRRIRRVFAVVVLAAVGLGLYEAALPLVHKAESEFGLPLRYQGIIREQAADKQLDPAFIAAVIYAETKYDARTSPTGAEGLMQIEPQTAEFLARISGATSFEVADLWKPSVNIAYGSYYLRYLLNQFHGREWLALAAYNAGETNVRDWLTQALARHRDLMVDTIRSPRRAHTSRRCSKPRRTTAAPTPHSSGIAEVTGATRARSDRRPDPRPDQGSLDLRRGDRGHRRRGQLPPALRGRRLASRVSSRDRRPLAPNRTPPSHGGRAGPHPEGTALAPDLDLTGLPVDRRPGLGRRTC